MSHVFLSTNLGGRCYCPHSSDEEAVETGERWSCQSSSLRDSIGENLRWPNSKSHVPKRQAVLSSPNVATESYSVLSCRLPVLGLCTLPPYFEGKKNTLLQPGHPISNPISPDLCDALGVHCLPGWWPPGQVVHHPCLLCWKVKRYLSMFCKVFPMWPLNSPVLCVLLMYWLCAQGVRNYGKVFIFVSPVPTI